MTATFVSLINWTEQGVKNFRDSPKRADAYAELAKKYGATVKAQYWTLGEYDIVAITEAPDPETFTALTLELASMGNVRTMSLRAFDRGEIEQIVAKTG
ncbi:MAG: GYD domain-containing protein [Actinobacteria bacterium]|nr:GYD domain-containing protein [Actinomycetota bacterium]